MGEGVSQPRPPSVPTPAAQRSDLAMPTLSRFSRAYCHAVFVASRAWCAARKPVAARLSRCSQRIRCVPIALSIWLGLHTLASMSLLSRRVAVWRTLVGQDACCRKLAYLSWSGGCSSPVFLERREGGMVRLLDCCDNKASFQVRVLTSGHTLY